MDVTVRAAQPADAAGIARVHVAAWQKGYAGLLPASFLGGLSVAERTTRWQGILSVPADQRARTLVAERDGAVAGFASVGPSRDDDARPATGELWAIYVDPVQWASGVGHVLHLAAVDTMRSGGATSATLWVLQGNERATRFYERHGWTAEGASKTDWRGDVRLDELRYRLPLASPAEA
jgi:GNAT superfamily N-acetyltransferase